MKRIKLLSMVALMGGIILTSCSDDDSAAVNNTTSQATAEANVAEARDYDFPGNGSVIQLSGNTATSENSSVKIEMNKVTITEGGLYTIFGNLTDGQLIVDADRDDLVKIILNDVNITSSTGAAIDVENADKVVISVKDDAVATLTDNAANNQDAVIYSRTKLSFFSEGQLNINSNKADAIYSKGGIIFNGGFYTINAKDDGIVSDFNIDVVLGNYGVNVPDEAFNAGTALNISGGDINVIQSATGLTGGSVSITSASNVTVNATGNGIVSKANDTKAENDLYISGNHIYVNAQGNGLKSSGDIKMDSGSIVIDSKSDAVSYSGTFMTNGGVFVAVTDANAISKPSATSLQNSVLVTFNSNQTANTLLRLQTGAGSNVVTFRPSRSFKTVLFSAGGLTDNGIYVLLTGGNMTGNVRDGLYYSGDMNYTGGTLAGSFSATETVSTLNVSQQ